MIYVQIIAISHRIHYPGYAFKMGNTCNLAGFFVNDGCMCTWLIIKCFEHPKMLSERVIYPDFKGSVKVSVQFYILSNKIRREHLLGSFLIISAFKLTLFSSDFADCVLWLLPAK